VTFADLFFAAAQTHGDRPFVLDESGARSYEECARDVRRMASRLQRLGVAKGDRIAVAMRNHAGFLVTWLALGALGAVMVSVNIELRGKTLRDVIADSGATQFLVDDDVYWIFEDAFAEDLNQYEVERFPVRAQFFAELDREDEFASFGSVSDTDPLTVLYSSGTTSRPKGALSSHRAYVLAGRDMSAGLQLTTADRFYLFLPLYHANPQYYAVASAIAAGASLALARRFSARAFWSDVERYAATLFTYVGSVLPILGTLAPPPAHTLRACVGGGVTAELWQLLEERWRIRVLELYGMTETAGFATINPFAERRHGTVGRARDVFNIRILDGDSHVAAGGTGEIVIQPKIEHAMFDGYVGLEPDETFGKYGFRTGDLGSVDDDGFFRYIGRVKEMIRVRGENIAPAYLEGLLLACPLLLEAAVVGLPSERGDEEIKLCAVAKEGATPDAISAWCSENLPRFMWPRYIELRSSIPRTSTMKIVRRELIEPAESAEFWTAAT
jgi:acyl-CoA synthetase (AMP-forming)/AMP-acid ligase II